jgi:acyl-ACP thioesterase
MPEGKFKNLQFYVFHDEDAEIYINGVLAATADSYNTNYEPLKMTPAAKALLKPGAQITLAIHCHQTEGGAIY